MLVIGHHIRPTIAEYIWKVLLDDLAVVLVYSAGYNSQSYHQLAGRVLACYVFWQANCIKSRSCGGDDTHATTTNIK